MTSVDVGRVIHGVDEPIFIDVHQAIDEVDLVKNALVVKLDVEQVIGGVGETVPRDIYPTVDDVDADRGGVAEEYRTLAASSAVSTAPFSLTSTLPSMMSIDLSAPGSQGT